MISGISCCASFSALELGSVLVFVGFAAAGAGAYCTAAIGNCGRKESLSKEANEEKKDEELKCQPEDDVEAKMDVNAYNRREPENFEELQNEYIPNLYTNNMFSIPEVPAVNNPSKQNNDIEMGITSNYGYLL